MLVGKNEDSISCPASENLRLIDDGFMVRVFQDISCAEFLIRQIMGRDDLIVKAVYPCEWNDERDHSASLHVYAFDEEKKYYIEIYTLTGDRKNMNLDVFIPIFEDGTKDFLETDIIFIMETDVFGKGLPVYHIVNRVVETGDFVDDGSHVMYVNASAQDDTALGRLMHDFLCEDVSDMHYGILADRVRQAKGAMEPGGIER